MFTGSYTGLGTGQGKFVYCECRRLGSSLLETSSSTFRTTLTVSKPEILSIPKCSVDSISHLGLPGFLTSSKFGK